MVVCWDCKVMRVKGNSFCNTFPSGGWHIASVTAVVVHGRANVPGYHSMLCPCAALFWGLINQGFYAWWCDQGGIIIEFAMEVGIGGEMRV